MPAVSKFPLHSLCTLSVGGPAEFYWPARSESEIVEALAWAEARNLRVRILGGGSNVVIADAGVPGLVLHVQSQGVRAEPSPAKPGGFDVTAKAGEDWDGFVSLTTENGWAGLECLSGIPGKVGATPIQNVGAYGQQVSDTLVSVRAFDRTKHQAVDLSAEACSFAYRDSAFKSKWPDRFVVLEVTFRLVSGPALPARYAELERSLAQAGNAPTPATVREIVLGLRRKKSMVIEQGSPNGRSCGSFFVNPIVPLAALEALKNQFPDRAVPHWNEGSEQVKLSAAWLIERSGFSKGEPKGPVGLSTNHALALVCRDRAKATDVVAFAQEVRNTVRRRTGVTLTPEPNFWGLDALT